MARPKEYTRWRRTAMQVVLAAALAVRLDEPKRFDNTILPINARMPVGWKLEKVSSKDAAATVTFVEPRSPMGQRRHIIILIRRETSADPTSLTPEMVAAQFVDRTLIPIGPLEFLGSAGVMMECPLEQESDGSYRVPIVFASAIVRSPQPVGVIISLFGSSQIDPADRALLKSLAQGLSLVDPDHPRPSLLSSASSQPARIEIDPELNPRIPSPDNSLDQ